MRNSIIGKAIALVQEDQKYPVSDDELEELEFDEPAKADFIHDIANLRNDLINMGYDPYQ